MDITSILSSPPSREKKPAYLKNNGINRGNFSNWSDITQLVYNNV